MARDHLIPHFEPRAFENFAALEPTASLSLSFLHPSRSDQRQILVELGAGQRKKGGISKVCQVSLQIGRSLSFNLAGWISTQRRGNTPHFNERLPQSKILFCTLDGVPSPHPPSFLLWTVFSLFHILSQLSLTAHIHLGPSIHDVRKILSPSPCYPHTQATYQ